MNPRPLKRDGSIGILEGWTTNSHVSSPEMDSLFGFVEHVRRDGVVCFQKGLKYRLPCFGDAMDWSYDALTVGCHQRR